MENTPTDKGSYHFDGSLRLNNNYDRAGLSRKNLGFWKNRAFICSLAKTDSDSVIVYGGIIRQLYISGRNKNRYRITGELFIDDLDDLLISRKVAVPLYIYATGHILRVGRDVLQNLRIVLFMQVTQLILQSFGFHHSRAFNEFRSVILLRSQSRLKTQKKPEQKSLFLKRFIMASLIFLTKIRRRWGLLLNILRQLEVIL